LAPMVVITSGGQQVRTELERIAIVPSKSIIRVGPKKWTAGRL
jgi:hypothetical protein